MKATLKSLVILTGFVILSNADLEAQNSLVLDGVYVKENTPARKPIPYVNLREADVMWSKRIWRKIDLREKINHPIYYPVNPSNARKSLIQVIREGVLEGSITAYKSLDDEFKEPMTKAEFEAIGASVDTAYIENPDTYEVEMKILKNEFDPGKIKEFRIKEDWFFDKQRSVMEVRIIGICPVMEVLNDDGSKKGDNPLFWIYYPEARNVFANNEVFNRHNDGERRTYEDYFWKRQFGSYIYKESNEHDRQINEYTLGMDALLEAERVKDEIFTFEHDLWEY